MGLISRCSVHVYERLKRSESVQINVGASNNCAAATAFNSSHERKQSSQALHTVLCGVAQEKKSKLLMLEGQVDGGASDNETGAHPRQREHGKRGVQGER